MGSDSWLGVEVRHLAALRAVAEEGSFGGAAVRLGYTQSAISQQMATLERLVGERLVDRPGGPRRVSLTEAGELLLRHAEGIMARLAAAQADLAALAAGTAATLRVGTYQSVGARILPTLLRRFSTAWPRVEIQLSESASDDDLMRRVENGDLDVTFSVLPMPEGPFEFVQLMRDPFVLLVPAGHPLTRAGAPAALGDFAELPMIGFCQCRAGQDFESHLQMRGVQPRIVFRSDDNGTVHGLVSEGIGVALAPRLAVDPNDRRCAVVELAGLPPRLIGLAWHRDRYHSAAFAAFVAAARQLCEELERAGEAAAA